jgi:hypothetical protein
MVVVERSDKVKKLDYLVALGTHQIKKCEVESE